MSKEIPVCIIDYSVHAHNLMPLVKQVVDMEGGKVNDNVRNYIKAMWALRLSHPLDMFRLSDYFPFISIVALDTKLPGKKYWRTLVAEEKGLPRYKGERNHPPELELVKQIGIDYMSQANCSIPYFGLMAAEADDIIAECRRIKEAAKKIPEDMRTPAQSRIANRHFFISTVDTDLLQLVQDDITFCWTGPWTPRVKDVPETLRYIKKKTGYDVETPQDFSRVKNIVGDNSDNLPPNAGIELFDLVYDPAHYDGVDFTLSTWEDKPRLVEYLGLESHNIPDHRENAFKWIVSRGYPLLPTAI